MTCRPVASMRTSSRAWAVRIYLHRVFPYASVVQRLVVPLLLRNVVLP